MWSKLYLLHNSNNKEVVVALMDTQVEQWTCVWQQGPDVVQALSPPQQQQQASGCGPHGHPGRTMNKCETTGTLMWSKLYLLRNSNNKEVVVALMDTQVEQWTCVRQQEP